MIKIKEKEKEISISKKPIYQIKVLDKSIDILECFYKKIIF